MKLNNSLYNLHMTRKNNIITFWWFTLIVVPIVNVGIFFVNLDNGGKTIFSYFLLFIFAFFGELFILYKKNVQYKIMHFSYIAFAFLISIFVTFLVNKYYPRIVNINWLNNILHALISTIILIIIKWLIWIWISFFVKRIKNKDNNLVALKLELEKVISEKEHLQKELENLNLQITKNKFSDFGKKNEQED